MLNLSFMPTVWQSTTALDTTLLSHVRSSSQISNRCTVGIIVGNNGSKSQNEYVQKLRDCLASAYKKAKESAIHTANNKRCYDVAAQATVLHQGDFVLIRNVSLRGKCKRADKWEGEPYLFISQPSIEIPVYEVRKDRPGAKKVHVLHRNIILPLSITLDKSRQQNITTKNKTDRYYYTCEKVIRTKW